MSHISFRLVLSVVLMMACDAGSTDGEDCLAGHDSDGDGVDDCVELAAGLNPELADSDGDGESDGDEVACGSNGLDPDEQCFACGWMRNDPGDLVSTGTDEGDVIANIVLIDQCEEEVSLWDFAQEYHILWMTAAW